MDNSSVLRKLREQNFSDLIAIRNYYQDMQNSPERKRPGEKEVIYSYVSLLEQAIEEKFEDMITLPPQKDWGVF